MADSAAIDSQVKRFYVQRHTSVLINKGMQLYFMQAMWREALEH